MSYPAKPRNMTVSTTRADTTQAMVKSNHSSASITISQLTHWQLNCDQTDHRIAQMAAIALVLTIIEGAFPSPMPGVKPGIANIVTLIVLARFGWRAAAWVALLRVIAGSILFGNLFSPGFFLSLSGALFSLAMLALTWQLPKQWFGAVTHSVCAAFAHISGQMMVVYLWLIPHSGIIFLFPMFAATALFFGTINGLIAAYYLNVSSDLSPLDTVP